MLTLIDGAEATGVFFLLLKIRDSTQVSISLPPMVYLDCAMYFSCRKYENQVIVRMVSILSQGRKNPWMTPYELNRRENPSLSAIVYNQYYHSPSPTPEPPPPTHTRFLLPARPLLPHRPCLGGQAEPGACFTKARLAGWIAHICWWVKKI